jgi:hypothetical protein
MVGLGCLAIFTFYQWTQICTSGVVFFLSTSVLLLAVATLFTASFVILRIARQPGGSEKLFSQNHTYIRRWGSLYDTLREGQMPFVFALMTFVLIRSAIIGFGQHNGLAQVVALIIVDMTICIGEYSPRTLRLYS